MDRQDGGAGDLVWVALTPEQAGDWQVLVLQRQAGAWRVVLPEHPDESLALASLPQDEQGRFVLVMSPPQGPEGALAVVLAPANLSPDGSKAPEHRWQGLQDLLMDGVLPVTVLDFGRGGSLA